MRNEEFGASGTVVIPAWDVFDKMRAEEKKERPPGSVTAKEYAERYKICVRTATRELSELFKRGKIKKSKIGWKVYYYKETTNV